MIIFVITQSNPERNCYAITATFLFLTRIVDIQLVCKLIPKAFFPRRHVATAKLFHIQNRKVDGVCVCVFVCVCVRVQPHKPH